MSIDVYEKLRKLLHTAPYGFPKTKEGIEIEILKGFFSEKEAELAAILPVFMSDTPPVGAQTVADQLGRDVAEVERDLDALAKSCLVYRNDQGGARSFALFPFTPGIFEFRSGNVTPELGKLIGRYMYKEGTYEDEILKCKIPLTKVVPINKSLPSQVAVLPYSDIVKAIEDSTSICVMPCSCRSATINLGEGCGRPVETCMFLNDFADYLNSVGAGRKVTKEEALEIFTKAEEAGCIHNTGNNQGALAGICSCCPCCCHPLQSLIKTQNPAALAKSDYLLTIDPDLCTGCETCIPRCCFTALRMENEIVAVDRERCVGCGACVYTCPTEALGMQAMLQEDITTPKDFQELWNTIGWKK